MGAVHHFRLSLMQAAAENDLLDDVVHRRANASLSFFAATQVFVTLITFVPNPVYPHPIINAPAAIGLEALSLFQWWVAGRNYAKYSEGIGANPIKIIKVVILYSTPIAPRYYTGSSSLQDAFVTSFSCTYTATSLCCLPNPCCLQNAASHQWSVNVIALQD